jgi:hypothetical protein
MARMDACYRFAAAAGDRRLELWDSVRSEIRDLQGILLLTVVNLGAPFCLEACVGDSSGRGYALVERTANRQELIAAYKY